MEAGPHWELWEVWAESTLAPHLQTGISQSECVAALLAVGRLLHCRVLM